MNSKIGKIVREAALSAGAQLDSPIYSDKVSGKKITQGYSEVRSVKLPFVKLTSSQINLAKTRIEQAGYSVIKEYFAQGSLWRGAYSHGVWGHRFIVGRPIEVPPTAKVIEHPATTAIKSL